MKWFGRKDRKEQMYVPIVIRILAAFGFIVLVFILFNLSIVNSSIREQEAILLENQIRQIQMSVEDLDEQYLSMRMIMANIFYNSQVTRFAYDYGGISYYERVKYMDEMINDLKEKRRNCSLILELVIYFSRSGTLLSSSGLSSDALDITPIKEVEAPGSSPSQPLITQLGALVHLVQRSVRTPESAPLYTVAAYLDEQLIHTILAGASLTGDSLYVLWDGETLLTNDEAGILPPEALAFPGIEDSLRLKGEVYTYFAYTFANSDAKLIYYIPRHAVQLSNTRHAAMLLGFIVVAIATTVFFSLWITRGLSRMLKTLVRAFGELEKGDLEIHISANSNDEFQYIFEKFNQMSERLAELIKREYQYKILSQQSALKQLQYQINPHFLYNSFFQIKLMAEMEDTQRLVPFSNLLGEYYRYINKVGAGGTVLADEYHHAENYVNIQRLRFSNRVQIHMASLPSGCGDIVVPGTILQPIIENTFFHPFKNMTENCRLEIGVAEMDDFVVFTFDDNGENLEDETILQINHYLNEAQFGDAEFKTGGIYNVHHRLRLFTGHGSGLQARRSALGGMQITLKIYKGDGGHVNSDADRG